MQSNRRWDTDTYKVYHLDPRLVMNRNSEPIQNKIIRKTNSDIIKTCADLHKPRISNLFKSPKRRKQMHNKMVNKEVVVDNDET
jgi:hypothetical protein